MDRQLKIIFAGTPGISETVLKNILNNKFNVELVLTQPDRPANRGKKITQSPVKELALKHDIEVIQPELVKNNHELFARIKHLQPDIMVVVAYGLILPQELLDIPKLGCINIHVSLLPKYRGAAPIQRAILANEKVTGVTIIKMDSGMDTGDILMQQELKIESTETSGTLHDKLANLGALMIVDYLANHENYPVKKQDEVNVSYAPKIEKKEAHINWNEDSHIIERKIRGFNPVPGCFTFLDESLIKIWQADSIDNKNKDYLSIGIKPGTIVNITGVGLIVLCGNNSLLLITKLQVAGKKAQSAKDYVHGQSNLLHKVFKSNIF
ncbi:predicted protein [Nematostella vectensis]|uniref:Methionyl-tRNA formyltransferase, mitochondrial n=1 Tax=Nematostella vectensis TaxID=45351 RepID=A8DVD0_NEMVE|nr:predicted protein [Nematostella vectensis]|eukprot:XP_001617930.1 hypothetical protein NEMVEDRAFT_v1g156333 [Nematostella vectensis]